MIEVATVNLLELADLRVKSCMNAEPASSASPSVGPIVRRYSATMRETVSGVITVILLDSLSAAQRGEIG